jgi:signal peptidase I
VLFIQSFFVQGYGTPTGSMEKTILVGDKMFFNQFLYGGSTPRGIPFTEIKFPYFKLPSIREPRRGDVVNFDFPGFRDELVPSTPVQYLKRIVGQPGDKIQVIDKVLYVNDTEFPKPKAMVLSPAIAPKGQLNRDIFPKGAQWNEDNYGPLTIPKQGDVVKLDKDNYLRWDTFIKREGHKIELKPDGKIFIDGTERYEYTVQRNYYFMMGDNRNNSLDSRYWGFVPRENIVGKAWFTYWSWDSNIPFSDLGRLMGSIRWDRIGMSIK